MNYATLSDHQFIVRLDPGDDIHEIIQEVCAKENINNASVQGIGSVDSPTLAHYTLSTKTLADKQLEGIYEVTSLMGNVALVDGNAFAHLHVTLADVNMQAFGGHLVKGTCSATMELVISKFPSHHWKTDSEAIGLKVWDFGAH